MEDQIARLRILEATRLRVQLEKRLEKLRRSDLASLVTSFVHDPGIATNLLKEILIAEYEKRDLIKDPAWKAQFIATVRVQAMLRFQELDSLSMLGAMNSQPHNQTPMRWLHMADAVWLSQMKPGRFGVVTGNPGNGKTDIAMRLANIALRANIAVVSNVNVPEAGFRFSPRASDLIRSLVSDDKPKFCIWDEMGVSWARKQAMSSRNVALEKLARIIRKFRSSLIVIIQEQYTVPPLIQSFSSMSINKTSKRRAEVEINNPECRIESIVDHIPRTVLPFDTTDIAPLELDVDIDRVFTAASGGTDPATQRRAIIAYLDKPDKPKHNTDKTIRKEIASNMLKEGSMSQMKIAKLVKLSSATVNAVSKEAPT